MLRSEHYRLTDREKENFEIEMPQRYGFDQLIDHYHDISFLYAERQGFYGLFAFEIIRAYPNLSIEEAIHSPFELVRAYAMFDYRVGKRRLHNLEIKDEHPLVKKFYKIRMNNL